MQWFMLPAISQMRVCSAMHMIQNGASLTIGPFAPLNMEIATDVREFSFRNDYRRSIFLFFQI